MNDQEIIEHIGGYMETRYKRGWWYTTVYGAKTRVCAEPSILSIVTVSMSNTREESISDALKHTKALVFKMVCFIESSK